MPRPPCPPHPRGCRLPQPPPQPTAKPPRPRNSPSGPPWVAVAARPAASAGRCSIPPGKHVPAGWHVPEVPARRDERRGEAAFHPPLVRATLPPRLALVGRLADHLLDRVQQLIQ